jgi:hypothetical protein
MERNDLFRVVYTMTLESTIILRLKTINIIKPIELLIKVNKLGYSETHIINDKERICAA